jgi:predicted enzyme related to lactoylglutathione lyase
MDRVVHFELNVSDPERTEAFFTQVFGWKVVKWEGGPEYWLVSTGEDGEPGINGAIMRSRDGKSQTVNTVQVASVDDAAASVVAAGGQVVVPKTAIPGVGYAAYCTDPNGLLFGIYHPDAQAGQA